MALTKAQKKFWVGYIGGKYTAEIPSGKTKVQIGHVYTYEYKSKLFHATPQRLFYYDKFPLIICVGFPTKGGTGWYGLNLHYLPPRMRLYFVKKIIIANRLHIKKKKDINKGKIKLPYGDLKKAAEILLKKESMVIFKRYLKKQVKSNIAEIPWTQLYNNASIENAQWMGEWSKENIYSYAREQTKKVRKSVSNKKYKEKIKKKKITKKKKSIYDKARYAKKKARRK